MKIKIFTLIVSIIFLALPFSAGAAVLSIQPQTLTAPQSQPYTITVVINSEAENINAVEGTVVVNSALGEVKSITDSGSIVTYWVNNPTWDKTSRTIAFSGTIPGGYQGSSGILFSLVMPEYSGAKLDNAISFSNIKVYRNDGLGTPAKVSLKSFAFSQTATPVEDGISDQLYIDDKKQDNIPPEPFSPQVARDDRVYDGQWFINFATTDKQSGIDHYEIQETRSGNLDSGRWQKATSPYRLQDQELHSFIYVIAVDRQGNERIIKVSPRIPLPWWKNYTAPAMATGIGIIVLTAGYEVFRRRKRLKSPLQK